MQCNAMQCNAMQCNAMQRNAMQCNAMQCNPTHYKITQLPDHAMHRRGGTNSSKIRATKQIQAQDQTFTKNHTRHIHKTRQRAGGFLVYPVGRSCILYLPAQKLASVVGASGLCAGACLAIWPSSLSKLGLRNTQHLPDEIPDFRALSYTGPHSSARILKDLKDVHRLFNCLLSALHQVPIRLWELKACCSSCKTMS